MGWCCEEFPAHEGYLRGLVKLDDYRFRELGKEDPDQQIRTVQAVCECGWRSPRVRRARTHCKNGHCLSGDNLRTKASGMRECIACHREYLRVWRRRQRDIISTPGEPDVTP